MTNIILQEKIRQQILLIRDQRVMTDKDLAKFYGVETKVLNQAVKRNIERFPGDFAFQLTEVEFKNLRSQFVTSSWGGQRYRPYVFTEQGVAMLSSVLKSQKAIQVNIAIMRVFVMVSRIINSSKDLAEKISELENKYNKHDKNIKDIFTALNSLIKDKEDKGKAREIGFKC